VDDQLFEMPSLIQVCEAANAAIQRGDVSQAEAMVAGSLREFAGNPNLIFIQANCAMLRHRDDEAIGLFQEVLQKAPEYVPALVNLGFIHRRHYRIAKAREILERAVGVDQQNVAAWVTLVGSYVNEGCHEEGEKVARQALERCPQAPDLIWNLSLLLLEQQKYREGWQLYRHRFESSVLRLPSWATSDGAPPRLQALGDVRPGDVIYCLGEQGYGDEILFPSMLKEFGEAIEQRGGRACFEPNMRLRQTFLRTFPACVVQGDNASKQDATWLCPIGDLGSFFRTEQSCFPDQVNYLTVDQRQVFDVRNRLLADYGGRPLVGLAWTGGQRRTHQQFREIPLECFQPVLEQPCTFVSLQYRDDEEEVTRCNTSGSGSVVRVPELTQAEDYDKTVHLVAALDLVITVPTSVCHAAGAVGTPCWVIMDSRMAWREVGVGSSLAWYPGTHKRYVREKLAQGWQKEVLEVSNDLKQWLKRQR